MRELKLIALPGIPEVRVGDSIAAHIVAAMRQADETLVHGDILVVAQKIVSKAEGRCVMLSSVVPGERAITIAKASDKDPRLIELVLRESREVIRVKPGVVIVEHLQGHVMANAGIDRSNVDTADEDEYALLLPEDPDRSAAQIRRDLARVANVDIGVIISDSFGRAWRNGVTGVAIGVSGVPALIDMRGQLDRAKRELKVTQIAAADELAAAASLLMGQAAEGTPVVLARGFPYALRESSVAELLRPKSEDLFR
jgi:coenzyme F420-0:L-glutamate ligase/coenzyme F420-1:gamma-L-glutamate ligase